MYNTRTNRTTCYLDDDKDCIDSGQPQGSSVKRCLPRGSPAVRTQDTLIRRKHSCWQERLAGHSTYVPRFTVFVGVHLARALTSAPHFFCVQLVPKTLCSVGTKDNTAFLILILNLYCAPGGEGPVGRP